MPVIGATSSFGLLSAKDRLSSAEQTTLLAWVRVTRTLPLGESGANSVQEGSRAGAAALLGGPLLRRHRAPVPKVLIQHRRSRRLWPDPASIRGQPLPGLSHDGIRGSGRPS